jgi:hypothetical protein
MGLPSTITVEVATCTPTDNYRRRHNETAHDSGC